MKYIYIYIHLFYYSSHFILLFLHINDLILFLRFNQIKCTIQHNKIIFFRNSIRYYMYIKLKYNYCRI